MQAALQTDVRGGNCLVSDAWDLADLQIPGRDPDLETLLHNRDFDRQWDTSCCGLRVCISTNVIIKTGNKKHSTAECCTWHMLLLSGSIHSRAMFFHSFQAYIVVYLKCCGIIHYSSYVFLWVQIPPCDSTAGPGQF